MQLNKIKLNSCEVYAKAESQMTLEDDYNVPDYRPDIVKILREKGEFHLDEVKAAAGAVWMKGHLVFRILYRSDLSNGKVSCLKGEIPFQEKLNMDGVSEYEPVLACGEIEDISVSVIHSRKINVRAVILLQGKAQRERTQEICTEAAEEEKLEQRRGMCRALQLLCAKRDVYRQKSELLLPQGKPNIREILWKSMEVRNLETELDRKGIQLKGEILISILYQEEGESGQLQWYETITPFNGTVECEIERDESVFFQMEEQVLSGELEVKPDADGEERMLVSELSLGLDIKIWQEKEIRMLEDLYALDRKLIPVCQDVETERLLVKNSSELRMTEQMKLDADKEILQICSCEGTVHIERTGREEKGLWAEGILQVELLYITSEDQMPVGAAKEVYSFEQLIEIPGTAGQQREELNCRLKQLQAVMTDQSHAEIKAVIELNLMAFEEQRVQTVVEVKEEPFDPKELQNRPGLLGYIAKDTDSLWAIAKKNGTTVKNIMEENGKKDDTLKKGERILIIKKVEY